MTAAPAPDRRALVLRALAAAAATGLLADVVVRWLPQGVDLVVLVGTLLAALALLARRAGRRIAPVAVALGATALGFAALKLVRDAAPLIVLDTLAALGALLLLVVALRRGEPATDDAPRDATPLAAIARGVVTGARVAAGGPLLATAAGDSVAAPRAMAVAGAGTLVRGGLLAAPVLLVFTLLLLNADPAFARLWKPFDFDVEALAEHLFVIVAVTWGTAGTLHAALVAPRDDARQGAVATLGRLAHAPLAALRIGAREVVVALALVNVLLVTFGALQLRWLFGGAGALATAGVTVAEYARRGFFELVTLGVLALALLVVAHAIVTADAAASRAMRAFRAVAGVLVVLLLVVLASAADRMRLYTDAFGLTEGRLYASALMTWLGVVFVLALATLLRARAATFVAGAVVAAWATLAALHVVNPDATIARVNLARGAEGKPVDARYLGRLSPDAAPALAARAPALIAAHPDPAVRCALRAALHRAAVRADAGGEWRGWRWPVARARAALPSWTRDVPPACGAVTVVAPR